MRGPEHDGTLYAISDVHYNRPENRRRVSEMYPRSPYDWLIVAGDVADQVDDVLVALRLLANRFSRVIWVPGNHELWTLPRDTVTLKGVARYEFLVREIRKLGVLTPEDPYVTWTGRGGPATIVPLFILYDYSFHDPAVSKTAALAQAYRAGVICTDEALLHPDPFLDRGSWCAARLQYTVPRLEALDSTMPTVLINHFPLTDDPLQHLTYPDFGLWCGTRATAQWHVLFNAAEVVYGHLHIPWTYRRDGVLFQEVSLGYPSEWQQRLRAPELRTVLS